LKIHRPPVEAKPGHYKLMLLLVIALLMMVVVMIMMVMRCWLLAGDAISTDITLNDEKRHTHTHCKMAHATVGK